MMADDDEYMSFRAPPPELTVGLTIIDEETGAQVEQVLGSIEVTTPTIKSPTADLLTPRHLAEPDSAASTQSGFLGQTVTDLHGLHNSGEDSGDGLRSGQLTPYQQLLNQQQQIGGGKGASDSLRRLRGRRNPQIGSQVLIGSASAVSLAMGIHCTPHHLVFSGFSVLGEIIANSHGYVRVRFCLPDAAEVDLRCAEVADLSASRPATVSETLGNATQTVVSSGGEDDTDIRYVDCTADGPYGDSGYRESHAFHHSIVIPLFEALTCEIRNQIDAMHAVKDFANISKTISEFVGRQQPHLVPLLAPLLAMQSLAELSERKYDEALATAERVIEYSPSDCRGYVRALGVHLSRGNYVAGWAVAHRAMQVVPSATLAANGEFSSCLLYLRHQRFFEARLAQLPVELLPCSPNEDSTDGPLASKGMKAPQPAAPPATSAKLAAARDFAPDEVVFVEKPTVIVSKPPTDASVSARCEYCGILLVPKEKMIERVSAAIPQLANVVRRQYPSRNPVPAEDDPSVLYCSTRCRDRAEDLYHWVEKRSSGKRDSTSHQTTGDVYLNDGGISPPRRSPQISPRTSVRPLDDVAQAGIPVVRFDRISTNSPPPALSAAALQNSKSKPVDEVCGATPMSTLQVDSSAVERLRFSAGDAAHRIRTEAKHAQGVADTSRDAAAMLSRILSQVVTLLMAPSLAQVEARKRLIRGLAAALEDRKPGRLAATSVAALVDELGKVNPDATLEAVLQALGVPFFAQAGAASQSFTLPSIVEKSASSTDPSRRTSMLSPTKKGSTLTPGYGSTNRMTLSPSTLGGSAAAGGTNDTAAADKALSMHVREVLQDFYADASNAARNSVSQSSGAMSPLDAMLEDALVVIPLTAGSPRRSPTKRRSTVPGVSAENKSPIREAATHETAESYSGPSGAAVILQNCMAALDAWQSLLEDLRTSVAVVWRSTLELAVGPHVPQHLQAELDRMVQSTKFPILVLLPVASLSNRSSLGGDGDEDIDRDRSESIHGALSIASESEFDDNTILSSGEEEDPSNCKYGQPSLLPNAVAPVGRNSGGVKGVRQDAFEDIAVAVVTRKVMGVGDELEMKKDSHREACT